MPVHPWKELSRRVYKHSDHYQIVDVHFELPNGAQKTYALTQTGRVVCMLAVTKDKRIVLARQYRQGPDQVLDELPGGKVDAGETDEQAARRELTEETGYVAGRMVPLGRFLEGAYTTILKHGYLALDCEPLGQQKLDPTEFIEVVLKTVPELIEQLLRGASTDCQLAWAGLVEAGLIELKVQEERGLEVDDRIR